eukprot:591810-Prymnesium_polylepis.1
MPARVGVLALDGDGRTLRRETAQEHEQEEQKGRHRCSEEGSVGRRWRRGCSAGARCSGAVRSAVSGS